ncbi:MULTISPECIES: hypothetical protein [unclassified Thioalkalivibrio]|uniref:hypothetical protein n=1 Tax=unclassified Thioalkalivibrio TaxID=2621013 RepID=UPI001E64AE0B|nr:MULTISPECIES: hypothetical protein [unclassified Thioalkalivibrio]
MFGPDADRIAAEHLGLPEGSRIVACATEIDFLDTMTLEPELNEVLEDRGWIMLEEDVRNTVDSHTHAIKVPAGWRFFGVAPPEGKTQFGLVPFSEEDDQRVSEYIDARRASLAQ